METIRRARQRGIAINKLKKPDPRKMILARGAHEEWNGRSLILLCAPPMFWGEIGR
jgi:hypothetical protein